MPSRQLSRSTFDLPGQSNGSALSQIGSGARFVILPGGIISGRRALALIGRLRLEAKRT
jgi:hypothetical protein